MSGEGPGPISGRDDLRPDGLNTPHPSRFSADSDGYEAAMERHRVAMADGDLGYMDPTSGLFVMAATNLASRPCCERGCRHCPYVT